MGFEWECSWDLNGDFFFDFVVGYSWNVETIGICE